MFVLFSVDSEKSFVTFQENLPILYIALLFNRPFA